MSTRSHSRIVAVATVILSLLLTSAVSIQVDGLGGGPSIASAAPPTEAPPLAEVCSEIGAQLTAGDANMGGFYCSDPWVNGGNFSGGPVGLTVSPSIVSYTPGGPAQQVTFTVSGNLPAAGQTMEMNWELGVGVLAKYRKPGGTWSKWYATTTINTYEPLNFVNQNCTTGPTLSCTFGVEWDESVVTNPFFADAEWDYYVRVRGDGVYSCIPDDPDTKCNGVSFGVVSTMAGGTSNNVQPPVADFTITPAGPGPGSYQLVSTSTNPNGGALDQTWTLSGGTASALIGPTITATFDKPGTYTATLLVRDQAGQHDTITKDIVVAAPTLGVAITPDTSTSPTVGSVVPVHITVSASSDGVGAISGVTFDDGVLLAAAPADRAEVGTSPVPEAFDLDPGATRGFDVPVTITDFGSITLSTAVSGFDAADVAVHDSDQRTIASSPIQVSVVVDPDDLELESNDDGPIPAEVTATITVSNQTDEEVTDVSLQRIKPVWVDAANAAEVPPFEQTAGPAPTAIEPELLGTLAPGQSKDVTATFAVSDSGEFKIEAQAISSAGSAVGAGAIDVTTDVILFVDAQPTGFDPPAKPGDTVLLTGYLKNTSRTDSIVIHPFQAKFDGHGAGGFPKPLDLGLSAESTTGEECAAAAPVEIKPRESWSFSMLVSVSPAAKLGPNRVIVELPKPGGTVVADDASTSALAPSRVRVTSRSKAIEIVVDQSDPPIVEGNFLTEFGHLTIGFDKGLRNAAIGFGEMMRALPQIGAQALDGTLSGRYARSVLDNAMKFVDYLNTAWETMPESEKASVSAWAQAWGDAWLQTDPGQAGANARDSFDRFIAQLGALHASNELQFAEQIGALGGQMGFDTVVGAMTEMMVCRLARGVGTYGKYIDDAERTLQSTQAERVAAREVADGKGLAALKDGEPLTLSLIRKYTGVTPAELQRILDIAANNKVILAFRSRSAKAAELLERGRAVLKNESWKIKTVSDVDIRFLGYREADEAIAVLRQPISEAVLEERIAGANLSAAQAKTVRSRWETRVKEWLDPTPDHPKYKGMRTEYFERNAEGWVDVPFDPNLNLPANGQQPVVKQLRRTALEPVTAPGDSPGEYFIIKQARDAGPNAALFPIVGDIDMIAILDEAQRVLESVEARLKVYEELQAAIGIQHGETFTLQLEGVRADLLSDHLPGNEPLLLAHPDGSVRAAHFDPSKSLTTLSDEASFIYLKGQELNLAKRPGSNGLLDFPEVVDVPTNSFISPATWKDLGIGVKDVLVDRAGRIFRATPKGVEEWNASTRLWLLNGAVTTDGLLHLSPQTATGTAPVGSIELPIASPAEVGFASGSPWFQVGDQVVIDPGGPDEQIATVTGFGSLILDHPLAHDIKAGTTVAMIPSSAPVVDPVPATTVVGADPAPTGEPVPVTTPIAGAAPTTPARLPRTGSNAAGVGRTAIVLLVAGVVLLATCRRRRRAVR